MIFNKNLSAIHAYLCADGYVIKNPKTQNHKYYHIGFRNTNQDLLKDFQNKFHQEFNIKPIICKDGRCKVQNKKLYFKLTKKFSYYSSEWKLPRLNKENLRKWLRAFFDCESWITVVKAQNRHIGLDSINGKGLKSIQSALKRYNINSKIKKRKQRNIFRLNIYGKDNLIKFQKEINLLHPDKKRKLNKAIKSYVSYYWNFPNSKKELKKFIINLLKKKVNNKRVRISSIKKENLLLLKSTLKNYLKLIQRFMIVKDITN